MINIFYINYSILNYKKLIFNYFGLIIEVHVIASSKNFVNFNYVLFLNARVSKKKKKRKGKIKIYSIF